MESAATEVPQSSFQSDEATSLTTGLPGCPAYKIPSQ